MTRWFWVRHGPTHQKRLIGHTDVSADLSDTLRIERLNEFLPRPARLFSSDLQRSSDTALRLQAGRAPLVRDPAIREFNFGTWDGRTVAEVSRTDPELSRAFWERPGDVAPPGGESWNDLARRLHPFIEAQNGGEGPIVAVAHFGVILVALQVALGISAYKALSHMIEPLSVTELCHSSDTGWQVERINFMP